MKVYRLVEYEGTEEKLTEQLRRSLNPGEYNWGVKITILQIDPADVITVKAAELLQKLAGPNLLLKKENGDAKS